MAELDKGKPVSLEELMISTLAMTDALAKLLIEKGVITAAMNIGSLLIRFALDTLWILKSCPAPGTPP